MSFTCVEKDTGKKLKGILVYPATDPGPSPFLCYFTNFVLRHRQLTEILNIALNQWR